MLGSDTIIYNEKGIRVTLHDLSINTFVWAQELSTMGYAEVYNKIVDFVINSDVEAFNCWDDIEDVSETLWENYDSLSYIDSFRLDLFRLYKLKNYIHNPSDGFDDNLPDMFIRSKKSYDTAISVKKLCGKWDNLLNFLYKEGTSLEGIELKDVMEYFYDCELASPAPIDLKSISNIVYSGKSNIHQIVKDIIATSIANWISGQCEANCVHELKLAAMRRYMNHELIQDAQELLVIFMSDPVALLKAGYFNTYDIEESAIESYTGYELRAYNRVDCLENVKLLKKYNKYSTLGILLETYQHKIVRVIEDLNLLFLTYVASQFYGYINDEELYILKESSKRSYSPSDVDLLCRLVEEYFEREEEE